MTFVAQTCSAAISRLVPGVSWSETRSTTSSVRVARLLVTTRMASARDARRDHRVCRVIRKGLVAISATSSASSRPGMRNLTDQQWLGQHRVESDRDEHGDGGRDAGLTPFPAPAVTPGVTMVRGWWIGDSLLVPSGHQFG